MKTAKRGTALSLILVLLASALMSFALAAENLYVPGTYTAAAKGFGGDIVVTITTDEASILTIEAAGEFETPGIGTKAIDELPKAMIAAQTVEVDAVAGATISSDAVKNAAGAAVEQALVVKSEAISRTMTPGTYEATVAGFLHDIKVAVTVDEDSILDVKTLYSYESQSVGEYAVSLMASRILEAQSYNVDVVAGATVTSNAYMYAVKAALDQAGADHTVFGADKTTKTVVGDATDFDADVIIIGAGAAGLTAAMTAVDEGAKVLVIEQMAYTGGSSRFAHGATLCVGADIQLALHPEDSAEKVYADIVGHAAGDDRFVPEIARAYSDAQGPAMNKLIEWGVDYKMGVVTNLHTNWCEESRYAEPSSGYAAIETLTARMEKLIEEGRMACLLNTRAEELVQEADGSISGVRTVNVRTGETATYSAPATILAFGGYSNNQEMLLEHHFTRVGCSSGDASTGTGFAMAEAVGAHFTGKGFTRCDGGMIPNTNPDDHMVRHEVLYRNPGFVWLNKDGVRVENEATPIGYERMATWYYAQDNTIYVLFNQAIMDQLAANNTTVLTMGNYACFSYDTNNETLAELVNVHPSVHKADTIEEVADKAGLDPAVVAATLKTYNGYCAAGVDDDFGKDASSLIAMEEGPYYLIETIPSAKSTYAGLMVDDEAHILNENGDIIPGLYGCGELIGLSKVFGSDHVAGSFWGLATSFGFLAGESAAAQTVGK